MRIAWVTLKALLTLLLCGLIFVGGINFYDNRSLGTLLIMALLVSVNGNVKLTHPCN